MLLSCWGKKKMVLTGVSFKLIFNGVLISLFWAGFTRDQRGTSSNRNIYAKQDLYVSQFSPYH